MVYAASMDDFFIVLYALNCLAAIFGKNVSLIRFYNGKPEKTQEKEEEEE